MDVYQILSLLGTSGVLMVFYRYIMKSIKEERAENKATRLGVQAMLRYNMIQAYRYHKEREYAPIEEKDSFENMYNQYHTLGENGVMDQIRDEFLALPTQRPQKIHYQHERRQIDGN